MLLLIAASTFRLWGSRWSLELSSVMLPSSAFISPCVLCEPLWMKGAGFLEAWCPSG